jgi:MFS family permease
VDGRPKRFRYTLGARWVSSIGDGLVLVAFPLLALTLTHNAILVAGVAFATRLPWLLVAVPAGALADRMSRRRLLTTVEMARMIVLLLLAAAVITHHVLLIEVYAAAFLVAGFETLFDSATMAVLPQLTKDEDLVRANGRMLMAQSSGEQFIGPALGGLLFAAAASIPVIADGASFAASAVLLTLALRPPRRLGLHGRVRSNDKFALKEPKPTSSRAPFLQDIRDGLGWLLRDARLRLIALLIATLAFCQAMGVGVLVIYCTRVLHLGGASFGLFVAVAALGNIIGAWAAPRVHGRLSAGPTIVAAGVLSGVALLVMGLTRSTGLAVTAYATEALAVGVGLVASVALRQRLVPLELAGRVSSAMRSGIVGAAAVGALVGGGLVSLLDARAPFAIAGAVQIVAAVVIGGALARRLAADDHRVIDLRETVDLTDSPAAAEA